MNHHTDIALPPRIARLERDHRGYPVPFIVLRDMDDKPNLAANNMDLVWQAIREKRCHVCGEELGDELPWFVGGPGAYLLNGDHAAFHDGPLHHECFEFSMQFCPHLSQLMTKSVSPAMLKRLHAQGIWAEDLNTDPTMGGMPEIFVAVQGYSYSVTREPSRALFSVIAPTFLVPKPCRKVQYWQGGHMVDRHEGERIAKRAARELNATR